MYLTLTLIILGSAVFVFFAEEFAAGFKTIFKMPVINVLLPILIATSLLMRFSLYASYVLTLLDVGLNRLVHGVYYFMPAYTFFWMVSQMIVLCLLTLLPGWILETWTFRRVLQHSPHVSMLNVVMFIILASLFVFFN